MTHSSPPELTQLIHLLEEALRQGKQDPDRLQTCVQECRQMGTDVLPLDINRSGGTCLIEDEHNIRLGLSLLLPEGSVFLEDVLAERQEQGAFQSFQDFCERIDLNHIPENFLENAIQIGAFDAIEPSRARLFAGKEKILQAVRAAKQEHLTGQFSLFAAIPSATTGKARPLPLPTVSEWSEEELIAHEKAAVGFSLLECLASAAEEPDAEDAPEHLAEEQVPQAAEQVIPAVPSHAEHVAAAHPEQPIVEPPSPQNEEPPVPILSENIPPENTPMEQAAPDIPVQEQLAENEEPDECEEKHLDRIPEEENEGMPKDHISQPQGETEQTWLILELAAATTTESLLLRLREVLRQYSGANRVILELTDEQARKTWIQTHADYSVQISETLLSTLKTTLEPPITSRVAHNLKFGEG